MWLSHGPLSSAPLSAGIRMLGGVFPHFIRRRLSGGMITMRGWF